MPKISWNLTLLWIALIPLACGTAPPDPVNEQTATAVPVRVEELRPAPYQDSYEAPGTVRAEKRAVLASKVTGTILEVTVKAGDPVRTGQPLVRIESEELTAEVSRAAAGQAAAERAVTQAEKGMTAAEAEAHLALLTFERFQQLHEKRSVSQQEFDQAEARHKAAAATVEMAAARVQEAQARLDQAAASLRAARVREGYAQITAPFAGIVAEKHADPGTLAVPGVPLLTLETSSGYRLEASLPEARVGAVRVGDEVRTIIPSLALETTGRVVEMEATADTGSRSFLIKISLPNNSDLHSGLFGRAFFSGDQTTLLTVPEEAVVRRGQLLSVFVASEGVARQRLVTLGRRLGDRIEVLSGLSASEQVILSNPGALVDGSRVEIRP